MYTRCPKCSTIFRITAAQLRVALGEVNCGSCRTSFNALNALSDELPELTEVVALEPVFHPPQDAGAKEAPVNDADSTGESGTEDATDLNPISSVAQDEEEQDPDSPYGADDAGDQDNEPTRNLPALTPDEKSVKPEDETANTDAPDRTDAPIATTDEVGQDGPHFDWAALLRDADEDVVEFDLTKANEKDNAPDDGESEEAPEMRAKIKPVDKYSPTGDAERRYDDSTELEDDYADELEAQEIPAVRQDEGPENDNDDPQDADELEFNAPEQTWSEIFQPDRPESGSPDNHDDLDPETNATGEQTDADKLTPLEWQTADPEEWRSFLTDLKVDENDDTDEGDEDKGDEEDEESAEEGPADLPMYATDPDDDQFQYDDPIESEDHDASYDDILFSSDADLEPPWASEHEDDTDRPGRLGWGRLVAAVLLIAALLGQLIHQDRDSLAAHPDYGRYIRDAYAAAGMTLYPDWNLNAFKVNGTEAVAGRSAADALDVLANVLIDSPTPVGLPMIRVVLRDRWSNPVASRVFAPAEYLNDYETWPALLAPGTLLPVEINVADPGEEAQGYVVDICLPRRTSGLECQIQANPFQK